MCQIVEYLFTAILLVCAYIDFKRKEVSIFLFIPMGICAILKWIIGDGAGVLSRSVGIIIGVLFLIISRLTKEAIGYGDSVLITILGLHMGGIPMLYVLVASSVLAGIVALFCVWKHRWSKKLTIPFIPFVAVVYLGVTFL